MRAGLVDADNSRIEAGIKLRKGIVFRPPWRAGAWSGIFSNAGHAATVRSGAVPRQDYGRDGWLADHATLQIAGPPPPTTRLR